MSHTLLRSHKDTDSDVFWAPTDSDVTVSSISELSKNIAGKKQSVKLKVKVSISGGRL